MRFTLKWHLLTAFVLTLGLSSCQSEALDRLTLNPAQATQLYDLAGTQALGNPAGKVTLVVIASYECHYCRKDYPVIKQFVATHPDVKLLYKTYLAFGPDTLIEPQYAALAAAQQQQYAAMNEWLFTTEQSLTHAAIMQEVKMLKLNRKQFLTDLHSEVTRQYIINNTDLMDHLGIEGIPTVIMASSLAAKQTQLPHYLQVGFINADVLEEMREAVLKK